jgi:putative membrane protein
MMGYGYGFDGIAFMWAAMLICLALVIAGIFVVIFFALRFAQSGHKPMTSPVGAASSARQILDDRYARGEIDHDEYRKRKELIG